MKKTKQNFILFILIILESSLFTQMLFRINNSYKNINVILEAEDKQGALYLGDYTAAINQSLLK